MDRHCLGITAPGQRYFANSVGFFVFDFLSGHKFLVDALEWLSFQTRLFGQVRRLTALEPFVPDQNNDRHFLFHLLAFNFGNSNKHLLADVEDGRDSHSSDFIAGESAKDAAILGDFFVTFDVEAWKNDFICQLPSGVMFVLVAGLEQLLDQVQVLLVG